MSEDEHQNLGSCCCCEAPGATVLLLLAARSPVRGHGWGCFTCGLSQDGAIAVLCEPCAGRYEPGEQWHVELDLRVACRGYPGCDGRIPFEDLRGEHVHRRSKHPDEVQQAAPLTVLPTDTRFEEHKDEGRGCFCSRCGLTIYEGTGAIRAWPQHGTWALRYHPVCFGADPSPEDPYAAEDWAWDAAP